MTIPHHIAKSRLTQLNLFPLMYQYKLNDLLFFIKSYKAPSAHFDIRQFVQFKSSSTRSSSAGKLVHQTSSTNTNRHFYFCRISRLWNALPQIDINLPLTTIKNLLTRYFGATFWTILILTTFVLFIFVALVITILVSLDQPPIPPVKTYFLVINTIFL